MLDEEPIPPGCPAINGAPCGLSLASPSLAFIVFQSYLV